MEAVVRHHVLSLDDYFAVDRGSTVRHEFADGQVYVMAGGSPRHDYLESRVSQRFARRLEGGPCVVMTSNRRLSTPDGLYSYADGSVFCGDLTYGPEQTATNPVVVIEVLSDSTRAYDRGEKLERYKSIPSLRHVVLVEQSVVRVDLWSRGPLGWACAPLGPDDVLNLDALGVVVPVAELYEGSDRFPT
ncbi:MAG: Uma2 family endonuclease [Myxococcota bacterium]